MKKSLIFIHGLILLCGIYFIQPGRTVFQVFFSKPIQECTIQPSGYKVKLYYSTGGATVSYSSWISVKKGFFGFEKKIFSSYSHPVVEKIDCSNNEIQLFLSKESDAVFKTIKPEAIEKLTKEPIYIYRDEYTVFGGLRDFPISKLIIKIIGFGLIIFVASNLIINFLQIIKKEKKSADKSEIVSKKKVLKIIGIIQVISLINIAPIYYQLIIRTIRTANIFTLMNMMYLILLMILTASIYLYFINKRLALRIYYLEFILRLLLFVCTFGFVITLIKFLGFVPCLYLNILVVGLEIIRLTITIFLDMKWDEFYARNA